jgi:hypothetical protein
MPGIGDQQVLQQLLTGMNTMQMQSGLMPGGVPALNNQNTYRPPPVATPAQFSNDLAINLRNTFSYQAMPPPMFGGITPVPRTQEAQGYLPGATMGGGWGMARQQAQSNASKFLTSAQTTTGFGARTAFGTGVGLLATPFVGPWGGAAVGFGADYLLGDTVERMAQMPFKPMIDQQQRAMQLQNMSLNNVRRGSDLSASGIGLSLTASMDLERNLMRTADDRNFKRDTGNMFNRQDMMKLTDISSQVGLLDNAQSVDQISRDMGKIGRALSTFMKVVEEPDVRKALQMMGQMRQLGMTIPETNVAAANARTYARMAGTTVQGVMQAGMQGAGMFQQYGMSGATGLGVGMAAAGAAGTMSTILDPRLLNLLGGREGMTQSLTSSAAHMSQITSILPGMLTRGKDGKLAVDPEALSKLAKPGGIDELVRSSASKVDAKFIQEYSYRKETLQDDLMNKMGPMGAVLMPVLLAKRFMAQTGITDMGAGLRGIGLDSKQAETIAEMYHAPDFYKSIRQQQRTLEIEQQKVRRDRRESLADTADDDASRRMGRTAGKLALVAVAPTLGAGLLAAGITPTRIMRGLGNAADTWQRSEGEDADLEEQQIAAGGGRLLRAVRPGALTSSEEQGSLAKRLVSDEGAREFNERVNRSVREGPTGKEILRRENERYLKDTQAMTYGLLPGRRIGAMRAIVSRNFYGPDGEFGLTQIGRGGEYVGESLMESEGIGRRLSNSTVGTLFGLNDNLTPQQLDARIEDRKTLGKQIEQGAATPQSTVELNRVKSKYGLGDKQMAAIVGAATGDVNKLLKSKVTDLGWGGSYVTGSTTGDEIDRTIKASLARIPNLDDRKRAGLAKELRAEIMRTVSHTANASEKEVLAKLESGGADIAGNQKEAVQQYHAGAAERNRESAIKALNMDTGFFGNEESQRAVMGIFGKGDNELQQQYLAVAAMDAAGDKEAAERLRSELRLDKKYTDEERGAAESGARKVVADMDEDDKRTVGARFTEQYRAGGRTAVRKTIKGIAETAGNAAINDQKRARVGVLGVEGADIFAAKGVAGLKKHLAGGGVLEGASESLVDQIKEGALTDADLERKVQKRSEGRAAGVFSGGLSNLAKKVGLSESIVDYLETSAEEGAAEEAAEATKEAEEEHPGSTAFKAAVGTFDTASNRLLDAANMLANNGDRGDLQGTMARAG